MESLDEAVAITPRDKIYSTIVQNPGLHFREIQRRVGFATGAMQYHLDYLKRKNFVREQKEGKFSRFYASEEKEIDSRLMNLLRQKQVRLIVLFLLNRRRATINVIADSTEMSISTANFHMKKLVEGGIVEEEKQKELTFYSVKEKEPIVELLIEHKSSFLDKLVDNFVSIWEEELDLQQ
jgi:predicted transcriptional regulator